MYRFFVTLHARPPQAVLGATCGQGDASFPSLAVPHLALSAPLRVSFDEAVARLAALPRMYVEPDGSFVWVSPAGAPAWQVDGVLYDRAEQLLFVDLKGSCPPAEFDRLLAACGWPRVEVMFQLTREALFVDEATFRRLAAIS